MAITEDVLSKDWTPTRRTIDYAPIKQTPFKDYLMGEQMLVNDPKFGPWTPEQYEKYKYTKTSDWLKEHPEDWKRGRQLQKGDPELGPWSPKVYEWFTSNSEMLTPMWGKGLADYAEQSPMFGRYGEADMPKATGQMSDLLDPKNDPYTNQMVSVLKGILGMVKNAPSSIASIPGGVKERMTDPGAVYGPHPEKLVNDLLLALGVRGAAKGIPTAAAGRRALPGATAESVAAKALESPEAMFSRYNMGAEMPVTKALPPGQAIPMGESAEALRGKYRPTNKFEDATPIDQPVLGNAAKENFIRQLMDKLQDSMSGGQPGVRGLLPESAGGTPIRAWESMQKMGRKYDPTMPQIKGKETFKGKKYGKTMYEPGFDVEGAGLDAALKEVDDILGGARTATNVKELRMKALLKQIYEMLGKRGTP